MTQMSTRRRRACLFTPFSKTFNEFFKRDGCLKRSDFALRMVQNELDELIFMFWRGAFKCGSMGWGGSRPVIDSRQRFSRERSAMCALEMFGVPERSEKDSKTRS